MNVNREIALAVADFASALDDIGQRYAKTNKTKRFDGLSSSFQQVAGGVARSEMQRAIRSTTRLTSPDVRDVTAKHKTTDNALWH